MFIDEAVSLFPLYSGHGWEFMFVYGVLFIRWNDFLHAFDTEWVGLVVWGRGVLYVRQKCVSYVCQQIACHMHTKTVYYMHAKNCISYACEK